MGDIGIPDVVDGLGYDTPRNSDDVDIRFPCLKRLMIGMMDLASTSIVGGCLGLEVAEASALYWLNKPATFVRSNEENTVP
jgi:hypothetical protein